MYEDDPDFEIKTGHFKDTYKTVYHPTFSNESVYSGNKSEYNPRGTIGGRWVYDKIMDRSEYRPSYSQVMNDDFDYLTTSRYIENSRDVIDDYYKDIKERAKNIGDFSNYAVLDTYYPFVSQIPYTGHSSLSVTGLVPNPQGDAIIGTIGIDKGGHNKDYNLITNNCSDATRCGLEHTFDKKINPFLFTTPGDVQDFALDELNAIPGKKDNYYFNPKTGKYQTRKISDAEKKANRGRSTVYIPINKEQRAKLIDFIHEGDKERKFANGGEVIDSRQKVLDRANEVASNYSDAKDFGLNPLMYAIRKFAKNTIGKGGISNCTLSATGWVDPNNQYMSAINIFDNPNSGYTEIPKEYALPGDLLIAKNPIENTYHTMLIEKFNENDPILRYSRGGHDTEKNLVTGRSLMEYHKLDNEQGGNHTEDHYFRYNFPNEYWLPELVVTGKKK